MLAACVKTVPSLPIPKPTTTTTDTEPDLEALWGHLRAEVTLENHTEWFASRPESPEAISALLMRLFEESVGACYEWIDETCDDHHHATEPTDPTEDAGIEDECAAQIIFIEQAERITEDDRVAHAGRLALLPATDLANAAELLGIALTLVPFETAVEDYALLAVHDRGSEGDESLREAVEATIEVQPEPLRRRAYRALAMQRDDPLAAMWAAESLAALGDSQFLPRWTADASLDEVVFRMQMVGAFGRMLPAEFVSSRGMTVRKVVHADRGTLEHFEPPRETVKNLVWAPDAELPTPWDEQSHLHPTATRVKCSEEDNSARCRSEIDGVVTTVEFEAHAGEGFKVRRVEEQIDFPDCML